ncbi:hypothetical protein BOSP111201_07845 [Bordetella sputigena]|uniref:S10 family serine carboxypeptidase-like protein n=1 Tax=Bordetella sputigena TaxID=1416810 RepID=UPI0039F149F7
MNHLLRLALIATSLLLLTACDASEPEDLSRLSRLSVAEYIDVPTAGTPFLNRFFSLLVRSRRSNSPLVIYLAGGPGASSMPPVFLGSGPLNLVEPFAHDTDFRFESNPWSWNQLSNVVYLDQPRYVGFYDGNAPYMTSIADAGKELIRWLMLFSQAHPELSRQPLYFAGESAAAEYIAQYAHEITSYNKLHPQQPIPLKGMLVQSGTIGAPALAEGATGLNAPARHLQAFLCIEGMLPSTECDAQFPESLAAVENKCIDEVAERQHIAADKVTVDQVFEATDIPDCKHYIDETGVFSDTKSTQLPDVQAYPAPLRGQTIDMPVHSMEFKPDSAVRAFKGYSPNPYNVSQPCAASDFFPPWCYDGYKLDKLFNDPQVRQRLWPGLAGMPYWQFASFPVDVAISFDPRQKLDLAALYGEALRNGLHVILAFGKNDLDINYVTAQDAANAITRRAYGKRIFPSVPAVLPMHRDGLEVAEMGALTFVQVPQAGHMIIFDQPQAAATLLHWLLRE